MKTLSIFILVLLICLVGEVLAGDHCAALKYRIVTIQRVLNSQGDSWVEERRSQLEADLAEAKDGLRKCQGREIRRIVSHPQYDVSEAIKAWREPVTSAARRHGLEKDLLFAVLLVESGGRPNAKSPKGALGLMQLMPGTAKELGVMSVLDPVENIEGGAKYLRKMMERFDHDVRLALAAYNAGPGRVESGRKWPLETQKYVRDVLRTQKRIGETLF